MALRLDQKAQLLAKASLFQSLQPEAIHVLAFSVRERSLPAGTILFRKGDASDGGFVVISGAVMLDPQSEALAKRRFGPGALIGEVAMVSATERPATATAETDTIVLVIPRALMNDVLEAHPQSAARLRAFISARLQDARDAIRLLVG